MHINLSPEIEKYLQNKVEEGFYRNISDVIRDAIRRMREEEEKLQALRCAVQAGDKQIAQGEGTTYTPELLGKITERAFENARKGRKVSRDVTP